MTEKEKETQQQPEEETEQHPEAPEENPTAEGPAEILDISLEEPEKPDPADAEPEYVPSEIEYEQAEIEELPDAAARKTPAEIKAAIECLLFTTPSGLSLKKMQNLLGKIEMRILRGIVSQLQVEYDARNGGIQVIETAEGYQMCTRPEYSDVVLRLHQQRKKNPLTPTALETLAIIAYKQPQTRAEIEAIRGVESSGVLRNLADLGLIQVVGRKEVLGRPQMYGTTSLFLTTFGLKSLEELPPIHALRQQFQSGSIFDHAETQSASQEEEEPADAAETVADGEEMETETTPSAEEREVTATDEPDEENQPETEADTEDPNTDEITASDEDEDPEGRD